MKDPVIQYPREDTCPKCGVHTGTILDPEGEQFAGTTCDACNEEQAEQDAVKLIEEVSKRTGIPDDLEATLWFVAVHSARAMVEAYSLKDWARQLIEGFKPIESIADIKAGAARGPRKSTGKVWQRILTSTLAPRPRRQSSETSTITPDEAPSARMGPRLEWDAGHPREQQTSECRRGRLVVGVCARCRAVRRADDLSLTLPPFQAAGNEVWMCKGGC